jgi:predicted RNA-binding Zn-ribbon protein involved in translation (DUF1610 family)
MGSGIDVHCAHCNYHQTFTLGVGMLYHSLEAVIRLVSPRRRVRVLDILHDEKVDDVAYGHALFVCPRCGTLADRFDFSISYGGGRHYRPYFRCGKCRAILSRAQEPVDNYPCPACGQLALSSATALLWD